MQNADGFGLLALAGTANQLLNLALLFAARMSALGLWLCGFRSLAGGALLCLTFFLAQTLRICHSVRIFLLEIDADLRHGLAADELIVSASAEPYQFTSIGAENVAVASYETSDNLSRTRAGQTVDQGELRSAKMFFSDNSLIPQILDHPYFDSSTVLHVRACHGPTDGLVIVRGLKLEVPTQDFLSFRVGTVGDSRLAAR
jgi:hypothetical protein